jgi:hypothetical protein
MTPYYPTHSPRRRIEILFWWALSLTALMVDLAILVADSFAVLAIVGALVTIVVGVVWARQVRS